MYEHGCPENINKLYKYAGKKDDQQQYKAIIESAMISTPDIFINNIPCHLASIWLRKIQVQENHPVS